MNLYENIVNIVTTLGTYILSLFPKSPFRNYINNLDLGINTGWFCWFVPLAEILTITATWLTIMSVFYLVSVVARWVKILSD